MKNNNNKDPRFFIKLIDGTYKEIKEADIQKHLDYGSTLEVTKDGKCPG